MPKSDVPQDESNAKKLLKKFKSQRAKWTREKNRKRVKSSERAANEVKSQEIDKWQRQQRHIYDKQREHEKLVKEAKKTLAEIRGKKQVLEDRVRLIVSLQKLREVRRKQLINVQSGVSTSSFVKSSREFEDGTLAVKQEVEGALADVIKEEEMIVLMMQGESQEGNGGNEGDKREKIGGNEAELKKLKRDEKWQKYLHKKWLKMQLQHSQQYYFL